MRVTAMLYSNVAGVHKWMEYMYVFAFYSGWDGVMRWLSQVGVYSCPIAVGVYIN